MLFERDVVDAVCRMLSELRYSIECRCETKEHGYDIVASRLDPTPLRVYIEAKGQTSSQVGTNRYGRRFNTGQVRNHVGQALYKSAEAASIPSSDKPIRVAIALPDDEGHRYVVGGILPAIRQWQIAIFWVDDSGNVSVDSQWTV